MGKKQFSSLGAHTSLRAEREARKQIRTSINFRVMRHFYAAFSDVARRDACAPSEEIICFLR
jgi:hypothetical protein